MAKRLQKITLIFTLASLFCSPSLQCWSMPSAIKQLPSKVVTAVKTRLKSDWKAMSKKEKILLGFQFGLLTYLVCSMIIQNYHLNQKAKAYEDHQKIADSKAAAIEKLIENHQDGAQIIKDIDDLKNFYYDKCRNPRYNSILVTQDEGQLFAVYALGTNKGFLERYIKQFLNTGATNNNMSFVYHYVPKLRTMIYDDKNKNFHAVPHTDIVIRNDLINAAYKKSNLALYKYLITEKVNSLNSKTMRHKISLYSQHTQNYHWGIQFADYLLNNELETWAKIYQKYQKIAFLLSNQLSGQRKKQLNDVNHIRDPQQRAFLDKTSGEILDELADWYCTSDVQTREIILEISKMFGHEKVLQRTIDDAIAPKSKFTQHFDLSFNFL